MPLRNLLWKNAGRATLMWLKIFPDLGISVSK
jgi:hypothetical protein